MSLETALRAVDLLVQGAEPGSRLSLAFLGGEHDIEVVRGVKTFDFAAIRR